MDEASLFKELSDNRIILLSGEIDYDFAKTVVASLLLLNARDKSAPILMYINSLGGDIDCLFSIYDTMQLIECPVKTICLGCAYSAGAVILSAGEPGMRYASENSHIMIHQVQVSDLSGTGTDIEVEAKTIKMFKTKLNNILARHTGNSPAKIRRDCENNKYMTATQAKDYGIVDHVLSGRELNFTVKKDGE